MFFGIYSGYPKGVVFSSQESPFNYKQYRDLKRNIFMDGNRKGFFISLTTLASILYMFRTLTGKEVKEVKGYLTKNIPGKGRAKLLVSGVKDFALVYKYSKRQLSVLCHYGFWNTHGFPLHKQFLYKPSSLFITTDFLL